MLTHTVLWQLCPLVKYILAISDLHETHYLTLYTFSFEIKESTLFDPKRLIHDVVSPSPRCSDKIMGTMHDIFTVELFCCDIISLECGGKQRK